MVRAIIKKTLSGVLKDKEEANILLEEAGKKIKEAETGDVKLTPRKNLLKKEPKQKEIKIGEKKHEKVIYINVSVLYKPLFIWAK